MRAFLLMIGCFAAVLLVPAEEKTPDPVALIKQVAEARRQVTSGKMEFVRSYPKEADRSEVRLKVVFDGVKRRFEQFDVQYSYVLMGPDAGKVTGAKIKELGLNREGAVQAGLLTHFDSYHVIAYDGAAVFDYWDAGKRSGRTDIRDPRKSSGAYNFDPRLLGLDPYLSWTSTIENSLGDGDPKTIQFIDNDPVEGVPAWHIRLEIKASVRDLWLSAANPIQVLACGYSGGTIFSTFDLNHPEDPIPSEVKFVDKRFGTSRLARINTLVDVPVDPASWTLAGLGMPVGTPVMDNRISRRIGYWDGSGLSETLPRTGTRRASDDPPPNPNKLLALLEQDPAAPFALEAAMWVILNTPDGAEAERAANAILLHHTESPKLSDLCEGLERLRPRCAQALLEAFLKNNPTLEVRGRACFALAMLMKYKSEASSDIRQAGQAQRLLERVVAEFGTVMSQNTTLAERATPELRELQRLAVGLPAPEIEGVDLMGRKMKLSDFRGNVVLLTFWGTWCGPCMAKIPEERELVRRLAGKPFALVGINSDSDLDKVNSIAIQNEITWPSFADGQTSGPIATAWNVHSWPTVYILDTKGVIRYRDAAEKNLSGAVDALLAEIASAPAH